MKKIAIFGIVVLLLSILTFYQAIQSLFDQVEGTSAELRQLEKTANKKASRLTGLSNYRLLFYPNSDRVSLETWHRDGTYINFGVLDVGDFEETACMKIVQVDDVRVDCRANESLEHKSNFCLGRFLESINKGIKTSNIQSIIENRSQIKRAFLEVPNSQADAIIFDSVDESPILDRLDSRTRRDGICWRENNAAPQEPDKQSSCPKQAAICQHKN